MSSAYRILGRLSAVAITTFLLPASLCRPSWLSQQQPLSVGLSCFLFVWYHVLRKRGSAHSLTCPSLSGMELFEEALRRWEQALTFRSRQAEDEACSSVKLGAGDAIAEESVDVRTVG